MLGPYTYFVLTVDPRLDLARLDKSDDLPLELLNGPPERGAHPLELDGCERLEVLHEGATADHVRNVRHVAPEVQVKRMARLDSQPSKHSALIPRRVGVQTE